MGYWQCIQGLGTLICIGLKLIGQLAKIFNFRRTCPWRRVCEGHPKVNLHPYLFPNKNPHSLADGWTSVDEMEYREDEMQGFWVIPFLCCSFHRPHAISHWVRVLGAPPLSMMFQHRSFSSRTPKLCRRDTNSQYSNIGSLFVALVE